jgi:hypothetical protein
MSRKKYRVHLNGRKLTRARMLLLADESPRAPSKKDREIVDSLGVSASTVSNIRQRFSAISSIPFFRIWTPTLSARINA